MSDCNQFQQKVLIRLRPILSKFDLSDDFKQKGVKENYLVLESTEKTVRIWVYIDEVAYRIDDFHVQCEKQDFDSDDDMILFFISSLEEQLASRKDTKRNRGYPR